MRLIMLERRLKYGALRGTFRLDRCLGLSQVGTPISVLAGRMTMAAIPEALLESRFLTPCSATPLECWSSQSMGRHGP